MQLTRLSWSHDAETRTWNIGTEDGHAHVGTEITIFGTMRFWWVRYGSWQMLGTARDVVLAEGDADTPLTAMLDAEDALLGPLPLRLKWEYNGGLSLSWRAAHMGHCACVQVWIKRPTRPISAEYVRVVDGTGREHFDEKTGFNTIHEAQLWAEEQLLGPIPVPQETQETP